MRVLIAGCGYTGIPLGTELVRAGHEVWGLRRTLDSSPALTAAGIQQLQGDVSCPEKLPKFDRGFDWVVNAVSSSKGGVEEYQAVYLRGLDHLISWLGPFPPQKFIQVSSTSVYGQNDSSLIKETSTTEPESDTSRILVQTERALLDAFQRRNFPAIIVRAAGIYGPGRGHLFLQYLRNEARMRGKGEHFLNMIHRDDLVGVIMLALKNGRLGEIYNAVDDEPVTELHFFRWLSETLGKWMPPFESAVDGPARKRGSTNKRVLNRKLKMELGYQFKYPTFRQGYTAEIKRLDEAGQLEITPEPR